MIGVKDKRLLKAFGEHLRNVRRSRGFSQSNLANTADISLSQVSRIERGEINPTLCTLFAISKALEVDLEETVRFKVKYK